MMRPMTRLRPSDVTYRMLRDHPWPQKWCPVCERDAPTHHKHYSRTAISCDWPPARATSPWVPR